MNLDLARTTIVETFRQEFDDARFLYFIRNLLNPKSVTFDEAKKQTWTLKKAAFEDYVNHFTRLGTYSDPDGEKADVLVIHLRKDTTLARGRVTLRNFVADYLATGHGQGKAAVIAAFVAPDEDDWRFSFVKLDFTFEKTDLGFVSERRELTPARRYSYLVGKNENCHTAQKQFLTLLTAEEANPTVSQLEAAFSIEKVTKEFFEHYRELFENTRDSLAEVLDSTPSLKRHFDERGIECDDFAKKLLGQIVFLYFLQKKGWFGVERGKPWGSGRKDFVRLLFSNRADYAHIPGQRKRPANFFNDILEPLFYEAIASPRTDDDHYYSRFDCRIPFLNGGLFEPLYGYNWVETEILLPDTLFANSEPTDEEGEKGTGILDVLDRYNFTVNESEPLEKEVAVDPEMLGKVFENLLPENIRHSSGTYYTPRVIVHYMCQQALMHYLTANAAQIPPADIALFLRLAERFADFEAKNKKSYAEKGFVLPESISQNAAQLDDLLATITVCDPAIGSGAFPVGMMHEIVRARMALTGVLEKQNDPRAKKPRTPYVLKRDAIQHSLYGVDLDPGAVEIAKLRLWLSMVVDEDEIHDIQPLPNLDYKIMQGNSLLEEFNGVRLLDDKLLQPPSASDEAEIAEVRSRIASLSQEVFRHHAAGKKGAAQQIAAEQEIKRLKKRLVALVNPSSGDDDEQGELSQQTSWANLKRIQELHDQFFDENTRAKKEKLRKDLDALEWAFMEATLREQGHTEAIVELKRASATHRKPFFLWQLHFGEVVRQRGGFDVVIANPPYIFARESKKKGLTQENKDYFYANYELAEYQVNLYPLFVEKGSLLLRPHGCLCFITPNNWLTIKTNKAMRKFVLRQSDLTIVNFYARVFDSADVDSAIVIFRKATTNPVVRLFEYTDGFRFVKEADCEFFTNQREHVINIEAFKSGGAEAVVSKIEGLSVRLGAIADVKVGLKAYQVGKGKPPQTKPIKEGRVFHSNKKVSDSFFKYLDGRDVCRYRLDWSGEYLKYGDHLAEPRRDFTLFSSTRILVRQIPAKPPYCIHACLTRETLLNDLNSMNVINIRENPHCVLGILNSKLVSWWFVHKFGKMQRVTFPQFKVNELADFPFPKMLVGSPEKQKAVERFVAHIVAAKAKDADADITKPEQDIDKLVYALYGLTPEEIEIVEGATK